MAFGTAGKTVNTWKNGPCSEQRERIARMTKDNCNRDQEFDEGKPTYSSAYTSNDDDRGVGVQVESSALLKSVSLQDEA